MMTIITIIVIMNKLAKCNIYLTSVHS